MTIKEEMIERRKDYKELVKEELQREVENVRNFTKILQKNKKYAKEFSYPVSKSGKYVLLVDGLNEDELLNISLKSNHMEPEEFIQFLQERLEEEGIQLKEDELYISLL